MNSEIEDRKGISHFTLVKQTIYSAIFYTLSYVAVMSLINTFLSYSKRGNPLALIITAGAAISFIYLTFKYDKKSRIYGAIIFLVLFAIDLMFLGGYKGWLDR